VALNGHNAVVTGGASGLGRAIAERLAAAGADVGMLDLDAPAAQSAADAIRDATGRRACSVAADASARPQVAAALQTIARKLGPIDILINNVGIWRHNTLLEVTEEEWDRVFAVNVKSALLCSQAVAPGMIQRGAGKIVNIASVAGLHPGRGWAAYQTSKAAMIMLGRILDEELREHGVRVNVVCPGAIDTPMLDYIRSVEGGDYRHAAAPQAVAQTVVGLVNPFEQETTGQVVGADGKSLLGS